MNKYRFPPDRILLATDMSETSGAALAFTHLLKQRFGATVRVVHAHHFDPPTYFSSGQMEALVRELDKSRRAAMEYLRRRAEAELGPPVDVAIVERPPAEAILEASAAYGAGLIIMGTHGRRGAERAWVGSVAERVLRESDRPVLAVRPTAPAAVFRHILCPVSLSDPGRTALDYAAGVAKASGARLSLLHAVEPGSPPLDCPLAGEEIKKNCDIEEVVAHGNAARTILEAVRSGSPDLIVMGAERKPSVFGDLFSSTTQKVMQSAPVPILLVPYPAASDGEEGGNSK